MTPHNDFVLAPCPLAPTPRLPPSPVLSEALQVCHPHAAGRDIGEAEHGVAVPPGGAPPICIKLMGIRDGILGISEALLIMRIARTMCLVQSTS